jgi:uridine phosphorylase
MKSPIHPFQINPLKMSEPHEPGILSPGQMLKVEPVLRKLESELHNPCTAFIFYSNKLRCEFKKQAGLGDCIKYEGFRHDVELITKDNKQIALVVSPMGSPMAAATLEELVVLGFSNIIEMGIAGAIINELSTGDIILIDQAIRDEGTSSHYLPESFYSFAHLGYSDAVWEVLQESNAAKRGACWTTDALYRETENKRKFFSDKVMIVNMETAALFACAKHRAVKITSIQVVADSLADGNWNPANGFKKVCKAFEQLGALLIPKLGTIIQRTV